MSNWIHILCPTFIHLLFLLSLFGLILTSIPFHSHHYSCNFTSQLWTSLSPTYHNVYNRIRLLWIACTTDLYGEDWTWLKILFSSALPESEETAFEEQFKYLIVSSTVLNDMSIQQTGNSLTKDMISSKSAPSTTTYASSRLFPNALTTYYAVIAIAATLEVGLIGFSCTNLTGAILLYWPHPSYSTLIFGQAILLGVLFTAHRKLRYTKIRRTYTRLLQHLCQILHVTRISDSLMDQLVGRIHDVETISQGHTLVPANSALETPRSSLSPQTLRMQCMARSAFHPYLKSITRLLLMSIPLTHPVNFATLRGLYNAKELFSLSPLCGAGNNDEFDGSSFDCEQVGCLVYMIRSCRREWFLRLLALETMTLGQDSARQDYENLLAIVERMMVDMERQTGLITENMKATLASDLYNEPLDYKIDQRSRTILNNLALLESHVRNLQAKIILCRHDAKDFSLDNGLDHSFSRLNTRFANMEHDITSLLDQWDENKHALLHIINDHQRKSAADSALPSPPTSPACTISKRESIRRSYTTTKTCFAPSTVSSSSSIPSSSSTSSGRSSPSQQQSSPSSSPVSAPQIPSMYSDHRLQGIHTSHLDQPHLQSWVTTDTFASFFDGDSQKYQEKFAESANSSSSQELPSGTVWSST